MHRGQGIVVIKSTGRTISHPVSHLLRSARRSRARPRLPVISLGKFAAALFDRSAGFGSSTREGLRRLASRLAQRRRGERFVFTGPAPYERSPVVRTESVFIAVSRSSD